MFATFGFLNIYVDGVAIGLFMLWITFIRCVQSKNRLEGQLSKLILGSSKPKFLKRMAKNKKIKCKFFYTWDRLTWVLMNCKLQNY